MDSVAALQCSPAEAPVQGCACDGRAVPHAGRLTIEEHARVLGHDGRPLPNLFAAGGAAAGVSGSSAAGYLSGNGLLMAVRARSQRGDVRSATWPAEW